MMFCTMQLACTKPGTSAISYTQAPENTGPKRTWLALGDSYTIGQSVSAGDRFPAKTANLLKQSGINIGEPDYIATTGFVQASCIVQNIIIIIDLIST